MAAGSPTDAGRARLTRERIVAAALEAVEGSGYEELTLRGLARRLGVTAPALYDHFRSKSALLNAVASVGYDQMEATFDSTAERAIDRCIERAHAYVDFGRQRPELFRVMFLYRPAVVPIEADNELAAANRTFERGLADIEVAVADGDLVARDPVHLNLTLWASLHGVAMIGTQAPAIADLVSDDVVAAIFRGLRPD